MLRQQPGATQLWQPVHAMPNLQPPLCMDAGYADKDWANILNLHWDRLGVRALPNRTVSVANSLEACIQRVETFTAPSSLIGLSERNCHFGQWLSTCLAVACICQPFGRLEVHGVRCWLCSCAACPLPSAPCKHLHVLACRFRHCPGHTVWLLDARDRRRDHYAGMYRAVSSLCPQLMPPSQPSQGLEGLGCQQNNLHAASP